MLCAADGHEDMIARLIEAGADVHAQDSIGNTPLHEAVVPSPFLLTIFSNMPPPSL
jgi:ankyrin repeat protein